MVLTNQENACLSVFVSVSKKESRKMKPVVAYENSSDEFNICHPLVNNQGQGHSKHLKLFQFTDKQ